MKSKYILITLGSLITLSGIGMFFFGVSMFTYQGPPISDFMNNAGKYSFICFLPTFIVGIIVLVFGLSMKKAQTSSMHNDK